VDANSATILAAILGAVIGGPAGFFIERLVNRPRLKISYAEAAYEDIYSFSVGIQQNMMRHVYFADFVGSQVSWSVKQRFTGNLFSREELRIIRELSQHYMELQNQLSDRIEKEYLPVLKQGDAGVDGLVAELETDYKQNYNAVLSDDLKQNREVVVSRLIALCNLSLARIDLARRWLDQFLKQVEEFLKHGRGTSDRIIIRISLGNSGYQAAIIKTEARLLVGDRTFRTPMQTASRPWESTETRRPSQFYVVEPKAFSVVEFLLDENLNARADLDQLREDLQRGVRVSLQTLGIAGDTAASHSFLGQLR